jgi:hypothetical protein
MNSPYKRAYEAGIKLARLEHFNKQANDGDLGLENPNDYTHEQLGSTASQGAGRGDTPGDVDFNRRAGETAIRSNKYDFDREAEAVQAYRDARLSGEVNPTLDGIPVRHDDAYNTHYNYSLDPNTGTRASKYINMPQGPASRVGKDVYSESIDAIYDGNPDDIANASYRANHPVFQRGRGLLDTYTNPIALNHEYAHALGHKDEAAADQYAAALGGYDMYDLADLFNQIDSGEGQEHNDSAGHLTNEKRMQMFAAPFADPRIKPGDTSPPVGGQEQQVAAGTQGELPYQQDMARNYVPAGGGQEQQVAAGTQGELPYQQDMARNYVPAGGGREQQVAGPPEGGQGSTWYDSLRDNVSSGLDYLNDGLGSVSDAIVDNTYGRARDFYNSLSAPAPGGQADSQTASTQALKAPVSRAKAPTIQPQATGNASGIPDPKFKPRTYRYGQGLRGNSPNTKANLPDKDKTMAIYNNPQVGNLPLAQENVAPRGTSTENETSRMERQQRERAATTFNVQGGGYGRQLARFKKQFGQGNEDLFQGDNAINYQQFAKAMDNRGLQVGDTFDARQVLKNLRSQRANTGPVATTMPTSRVGVQRGGRDVNRFQNLNQQRATGQSNTRLPDGLEMPDFNKQRGPMYGKTNRLPMIGQNNQ